jgi:adenine phosphoribosyltransferase
MDFKALIRDIPDFPKPGILFRDLTTLWKDPEGWRSLVDQMAEVCQGLSPQYIAGMESRGFILGAAIAYKLGIGFIPVRKPGKLPAAVYAASYDLEYGSDRLEMHQDACEPGSKVLIVDDLIATGGTAAATAKLIDQAQGELVGFVFAVELLALNGRQNLPEVPFFSIIQY